MVHLNRLKILKRPRLAPRKKDNHLPLRLVTCRLLAPVAAIRLLILMSAADVSKCRTALYVSRSGGSLLIALVTSASISTLAEVQTEVDNGRGNHVHYGPTAQGGWAMGCA